MANITQRGEIQICLCNIQGVMCVLEQLIRDFTSDTDSRYGRDLWGLFLSKEVT